MVEFLPREKRARILFLEIPLHLFLRIRLDQIPLHHAIERFDDFCSEETAITVDDLNISYNVKLSPDQFLGNGVPDFIRSTKNSIFIPD